MAEKSTALEANNPTPLVSNKEPSKNDIDLDGDEFDLGDDFIALPNENETAEKKSNARRKIEMYWEKKQLREQLGDIDFDF